ncbi:MAG: hypothetical protein AB7V32_04570 [Candidatus Berkiella sp.]
MNSTSDLSLKTNLHGVFLNIFDKGILLTGKSGVGKSECALALLDRGHQLICDDAPIFERRHNQLFGTAPLALLHLLEVRGLGIINVQHVFGRGCTLQEQALDLVLELAVPPTSELRSDNKKLFYKQISGVSILHLSISVMLKSQMAILVETAVKLAFSSENTVIKNAQASLDISS